MMSKTTGSNRNNGNSRRYTLFNCHENDFAIDIADVQEVLVRPRLTRIPNVKSNISGVFNLRGKIYTVMDLNQLFGMHTGQVNENPMIILIGKPNASLGISVDQVNEMITIEEKEISMSETEIPSSFRQFISGYLDHAGSRIYFIDAARLIKQEPGQG